jgi:hypothetical protein
MILGRVPLEVRPYTAVEEGGLEGGLQGFQVGLEACHYMVVRVERELKHTRAPPHLELLMVVVEVAAVRGRCLRVRTVASAARGL